MTMFERPPSRVRHGGGLAAFAFFQRRAGGARAALALDLKPQHVIGDFDSLSDGELHELERHGAQLHRHSPRKDETDLELALLFAVGKKTTENTEGTETTQKTSVFSMSSVVNDPENDIIVLGAVGGRHDQELANILLLAMPQLARNAGARR